MVQDVFTEASAGRLPALNRHENGKPGQEPHMRKCFLPNSAGVVRNGCGSPAEIRLCDHESRLC
jgi:hypothetical protein